MHCSNDIDNSNSDSDASSIKNSGGDSINFIIKIINVCTKIPFSMNDLQDKILEKAKKLPRNSINNECECYVVPMNKEINGYISLFISCMSEIKSEDFRNLKISSFDIDIKENKVKIYVNKEKY